ncbi:MAG: hypothetical protein JW820_10725 [Spirochaetales bacterium]|nr:hypothetical protein [Spirochaetales bacterium]
MGATEPTAGRRSPRAAADPPFLAVDLGASSGRVVLGRLVRGRRELTLELTEVHRFENRPVRLGGTVFWDFLHLWGNVIQGLSICAASGVRHLAAMGVDSWNLDFGLVDEEGWLLGNPVSYRDQSAGWVAEEIPRRLDPFELYRRTGMPVLPISGLARLIQMGRDSRKGLLELARWCLPIPDLVRFYLSGDASIEETISWGTQLVDLDTRRWSEELIARFGIPRRLLPDQVEPGSPAGTLSRPVAETTGVAPCPVIAVAEHDTVSAAFAAGALEPGAAILSVGTWSILGCPVETPAVSPEAREWGFMTELAYGRLFLAKSGAGFYLLEELVRCWQARGIDCDYQVLAARAVAAAPGRLRIDPDDPVFFSPANLEEVFREYCAATGQEHTEDVGVIVRGLYEGLAASHAKALEQLSRLTRREFRRIVLVGGVVRNSYYCGLVADACGVELIAGPAEATVVGNLCIQALALERARPEELGALVGTSFPIGRYHPGGRESCTGG